MSKWLNVRLSGDEVPKHELFGTEDEAASALEGALDRHRQRGRQIDMEVAGGDTRWVVSESGEFVAKYWLSDTKDGGAVDTQ